LGRTGSCTMFDSRGFWMQSETSSGLPRTLLDAIFEK
jgi:hypothetical protein